MHACPSALAANAGHCSNVTLIDQMPAQRESAEEVIEGLCGERKSIAPKYFYDEQGSRLFDQITRLPEYYLTRTEIGILRRELGQVADLLRHGGGQAAGRPLLLECGSGSGEKARILIDALQPQAYVAIDISRDYLVASAQSISADYPELDVYALCADYSRDWHLPPEIDAGASTLAFFPGSSLGNFEPAEAVRFLAGVRGAVGIGGHLLVGIDPPKDRQVLEAAYNDSGGVTARFNLNILSHLNRIFDGDFSLAEFRHEAVYNEALARIELYLVSQRDQQVQLAGRRIAFAKGERVHTENSYKYSYDVFLAMAWQAGYKGCFHCSDPAGLFSVYLLRA